MRDETKSEPRRIVMEADALMASGLFVKLGEHDGKKCLGCSEFWLQFVSDDETQITIKMSSQEFHGFYTAMERALEKLAETFKNEKGENA